MVKKTAKDAATLAVSNIVVGGVAGNGGSSLSSMMRPVGTIVMAGNMTRMLGNANKDFKKKLK